MPARTFLAGLGFPGQLGAGGGEYRPVVADGRAGAARGGRQWHRGGDHADGLGVAEHHPDRQDLDQHGGDGAGEAPPPVQDLPGEFVELRRRKTVAGTPPARTSSLAPLAHVVAGVDLVDADDRQDDVMADAGLLLDGEQA